MDNLSIILVGTYLGILIILMALANTLKNKGHMGDMECLIISILAVFWPVGVIVSPFFLIVWLLSKVFDKIIPNKN